MGVWLIWQKNLFKQVSMEITPDKGRYKDGFSLHKDEGEVPI